MTYSVFRNLTFEEIRELYNKDYRQLSKYEFFRLYREEQDSLLREKYCRQALEMYPSLMVAANDLQALLISQNRPEVELLEKFAGAKAPATVNANHTVALLSAGKYNEAVEVAQYLPDTEDTKFIKAISQALGGKYEEAYPIVAETGLRNEVLMLLTMKRNEEAWKKAQGLDIADAMTYYIRAICLNRLEKPNEAYDELKHAFKMDPNLIEIARLDGDVNDLLPENN
jgi:tetratricopeptide (TPR) repeat protein